METTSSLAKIQKGPIYQIMTKDSGSPRERFSAITRRIPEIRSLNMNAIWLTGVCSCSGYGNTPFGLYDPLAIEPSYGTQTQLRQLIDSAHSEGMIILADLIGNHISKDSKYLLPGSPDRDMVFWENESTPLSATDYRKANWRFDDVAQLDFSNPKVKQMIFDMAFYLMDQGFDGLRIDAPAALLRKQMIENWYEGQPDKIAAIERLYPQDPLKMIIDAVRQRYPGAPIIAEAMGRHDEVVACGADLVYDFSVVDDFYKLLKLYGQDGWKSPADVIGTINAKAGQYVFTCREIRIKDGHDVRDVKMGGKGLSVPTHFNGYENKLLAIVLATLPGVPMYFNAELEAVIGYAYNRYSSTQIDWQSFDPNMRDFYRAFCDTLLTADTFRFGSAGGLGYHGSNIGAFWRSDDSRTFVVAAHLNPYAGSAEEWVNLGVTDLVSRRASSVTINNIFGTEPMSEHHWKRTPAWLTTYGLPVRLKPKEAQVFELIYSK